MKTGRSLNELANEITRQADAKKDYKVATRAVSMVLGPEETPQLQLGDTSPLGITSLTHNQIGDYTGVPRKYYEKMQEEMPSLLATNVNAWMRKAADTRLVRTLDGKARAFLSDRYRPLDNYDLASVALEKLQKTDCKVMSCELTETRLYIKAVTERITSEVKVGDIVQAGIVISNSEVGLGAIKIEPLLYRLSCKNGMIANDFGMRRHHVGRAGGELTGDGYEIFLRDATREADDRAFWMKVGDVIAGSLDQVKFAQIVGKMTAATQDVITNPLQVMEVTQKRFNLTDVEKAGVLTHLVNGGDLSRYGLLNAVTRYSQDVGDYDKATDFERLGGTILELPKADWKVFTEEVKN
ncbi:MAG: DUF932 domain-containing protein [Thermodesulfovibrionales bacterium]|jgi:hypothetical protein